MLEPCLNDNLAKEEELGLKVVPVGADVPTAIADSGRPLTGSSSSLYLRHYMHVAKLYAERNHTELLDRLDSSESKILNSQECLAEQVILEQKAQLALQMSRIEKLQLENEEQSRSLAFLEDQERLRHEAALSVLARKERKKQQRKKAIRDGASLPEFLESIKIIKSKRYRSEFVRSREIVSLLVLFLTGIRVANLREVTASNLECLLSGEKSAYFQVNAIKSRQKVVYSTFLSSVSLCLAQAYRSEILVLLRNKRSMDYVFTSDTKSVPIDRATLTRSLNVILRAAGKVFKKNISSHSFRIGHVTALIEEFGLFQAQKLIGHANSETTVRYARNKLETRDFEAKMCKVDKQKHNKISRHKKVSSKFAAKCL